MLNLCETALFLKSIVHYSRKGDVLSLIEDGGRVIEATR